MTLAQQDLDRLDPNTMAVWETLAGLREGQVMTQLADHLMDVVAAVIEHISIDDKGKVTGPTGSVTLNLVVSPSQEDPERLVNFTDKIAWKKPEDRTHPVYVGAQGSVSVRDPRGLYRHSQLALVEPDDIGVPTIPIPDAPETPAAEDRPPAASTSPFTVDTPDQSDDNGADREGDGNVQYPD